MSTQGANGLKEVTDGLKSAKEALDCNPAETIGMMKEVAAAGVGVFKIIGGLDAIYTIYELWGENSRREKLGLKDTIGDKALRGVKVAGNVAFIVFSGIGAAVAFGASVIAAPIVGVVLGSISVVKNSLELVAVTRDKNAIEKRIKESDKELKAVDVEIERNLALFHDIADTQAEINDLKEQRADIQNQLDTLDEIGKSPLTKKTELNLNALIEARKQELAEKVEENLAIANIESKIQRDVSTLEDDKTLGPQQKKELMARIESNRSKLEQRKASSFDPVKFSENKINEYAKQKGLVENEIKALERELPKPLTVEQQEKIDNLHKDITKIDDKIAKHETLIRFNEQLKEYDNLLAEANSQLKNVDEKYNKKPYLILDTKVRENLVGLERGYLEERIKSLKQTIVDFKDPEKRLQENVALRSGVEQLNNPELQKRSESLRENLNQALKEIAGKLEDKIAKLGTKKEYTKLLLTSDALADPKRQTKELLDKRFDKILDRAELDQQLKLKKIESKKKVKNILLGLAGLGLAIAACIPPAQALLAVAVIAVGVVTGINALYDIKQKRDQQSKGKTEISKLTKEHVTHVVEHSVKLDRLHNLIDDTPREKVDPSKEALAKTGDNPLVITASITARDRAKTTSTSAPEASSKVVPISSARKRGNTSH